MHKALGVADRMRDRGSVVVRDYMPDQHRSFFADQRMVILSALDGAGHPWPFLRIGAQGFMTSPAPDVLCITSRVTAFEHPDLKLVKGSKISVLGIEFETKRRNRLNGTIRKVDGDTLTIAVDQSFGNCPKYIHVRDQFRHVERTAKLSDGPDLNPTDITQIEAADTCFIASRAAEIGTDRRAGVDVNHRGGRPGFVHVTKDRHLIIPDYDGNKFFNTIGNILLESRASLMFIDFDRGDVMTLKGNAKVELDAGAKSAVYGAERVIHFIPKHVLRAQSALPLTCDFCELSRDPPN